MKLLAIGFVPPPLGGVSVSFKLFCDLVATQNRVDLQVINLSGIRARRSVKSVCALVRHIWKYAARCDVATLYCATSQIPTVGLLTLCLCRLRKKPFILRKAGGTDHRELGAFFGRVAEFVMKHADLFLAETKYLVDLNRRRGIVQTRWYPTTRRAAQLSDGRTRCRRFVFVGQVRLAKGVMELVKASDRLPSGTSVDVYGPLFDDLPADLFEGRQRIFYKGALKHEDVVPTLRQYDAFVLPTKAPTEGYPGAILEAYGAGLPVITTTCGAIPEIVDDTFGILVEPGDAEALAQAMNHLVSHDSAYQRLCCGARDARERFSAEQWIAWFLQQCRYLCRQDVGHARSCL